MSAKTARISRAWERRRDKGHAGTRRPWGAAQDILLDITHKICGDLPDRLHLRRAPHALGGLKYQRDLLMFLDPDRLQRAKNAVLIDGFQVLRDSEARCVGYL